MSLAFIDTNILVYAYDADAGRKHQLARQVLEECWQSDSGAISTQILQEFYVTVTKKLPTSLPKQKAREVIETYHVWPVYRPTEFDIVAASEFEEKHQILFWDALVILAAQKSHANVLYTEDLNDGWNIEGLKIINPLK
jgi:predicted nucleic acid-binding protein